MKWEPMETAPQDGTPFLACWKRTSPSEDKPMYAVSHFAHGVIWPDWIYIKDHPTHWMKLPEPPK